MEHIDDPWFIAMAILLVVWAFVTLYAVRGYVREWIVLAMALPPAIFKKMFGDPPAH